MAKRGALTHRRTRRLSAALGLPLPCALGIMEAVWHTTADRTPRGDIGRLSDQDIADEIWWPDNPETLVKALVQAGVLDTNPEHRLVVHGWSEHADDAVRKKLTRAGHTFTDGSAPWHNRGETRLATGETHGASVLPPEPVPEPVPEPEPVRKQPRKAAGAAFDVLGLNGAGPALEVLAYWQERSGTKLRSPKAKEQILARLKSRLRDGCSADDLRACVDFALADEFYVEKGYAKKPDVIWRSAERVQDLANRYDARAPGQRAVVAEARRTGPTPEELARLDAETDR